MNMNKNIENRHESEKQFHDKKFSHDTKQTYYDQGFTIPIFENMMKKVGNIEGLKVLEYGCGTGWFTKRLAKMGAHVWSFDISTEAVNRTNKIIKDANLQENVHVEQMAGEQLRYNSDKFDLVIGLAILHHLDIDTSLKEIKRVLKNGGRCFFLEPLGHNPIINLYRKMTPNLRSSDETPLSFNQFETFKSIFPKFIHSENYFLTVIASIFHFLGSQSLMKQSRDFLIKIDDKLIKTIPFIRRYCWYSILEFKK